MFEVELKTKVDDEKVELLLETLDELAGSAEFLTYNDTYFNNKQDFVSEEKELRLRQVDTLRGSNVVLTCKGAPFDLDSKSKPEYEVDISDQQQMQDILLALGFFIDVQFSKMCRIYRLEWQGFNTELTVAEVPELDTVFLEAEILLEHGSNTGPAFDALYSLLAKLHIPKSNLTSEYYTDAVKGI